MNRNERLAIGAVAVAAWMGLLIQADVSFTGMRALGLSWTDATIRFFSYFTVLTNSLIAVESTICVVSGNRRWSESDVRTSLATGLAVSIFFVGVCYNILLRNLLHLKGDALLANTILHDVVPVLYIFYWALFAARHRLPWNHAGLWLLYPFLYFLYVLVQGWRTGLYPYPFIDAVRDGYPHALRNGAILLVSFWVGGFCFIAAGRLLYREVAKGG